MADVKARLANPANAAYLAKAIAILTDTLRAKLDSGDHCKVTIEVDLADGHIRGLVERGERWWRGDSSLNKY